MIRRSAPDEAPAEVTVPRSALVELRSLIVGMVFGALVIAGAFIWFAARQTGTNDHLGRTDGVLVEFIRAELAEEEREQAAACIDAHGRYEQFEALAAGLTRAGATVGTEAHLNLMGTTDPAARAEAEAEIDRLLPDEIAPLLDRYPAPACDLDGAEATMDRPVPEPPDVEELIEHG